MGQTINGVPVNLTFFARVSRNLSCTIRGMNNERELAGLTLHTYNYAKSYTKRQYPLQKQLTVVSKLFCADQLFKGPRYGRF